MASGYVKCSCSIKNATAFPPFPELKSFQICLTGDTINDGERSSENGLNPLKLLPARLSCTKSPMTSSTRAVSNTVSMDDFEIKGCCNLKFRKASKLGIFCGCWAVVGCPLWVICYRLRLVLIMTDFPSPDGNGILFCFEKTIDFSTALWATNAMIWMMNKKDKVDSRFPAPNKKSTSFEVLLWHINKVEHFSWNRIGVQVTRYFDQRHYVWTMDLNRT